MENPVKNAMMKKGAPDTQGGVVRGLNQYLLPELQVDKQSVSHYATGKSLPGFDKLWCLWLRAPRGQVPTEASVGRHNGSGPRVCGDRCAVRCGVPTRRRSRLRPTGSPSG